MTRKEAAKILRDISTLALPTVNGIPFPQIKEALELGADALDPRRTTASVGAFTSSDRNSDEELRRCLDDLNDRIQNGRF